MPYIPHTESERREMLRSIGVRSIDDLFAPIPKNLRVKTAAPGADRPADQPLAFDLPPGISEHAVRTHLQQLAAQNATNLTCFVGGGFYDHYIPSAVDSLAGRSEFVTAYTPYQPEMSQGSLQAMYEYQSAICRLTGMQASNASLYDGGTALCEALLMAARINDRPKVIVDACVNPLYRKMLDCYTTSLPIEIIAIEPKNGRTDHDAISRLIGPDTSAIILQNPNFFGVADDYTELVAAAHAAGAVAIASVYPISLGLLKTPGAMCFDIAVGEGQSLGLPLSFGGPYLGFMAALKTHVRKMPGRIIGQTKDHDGRRGFVMTLQAREQHIRREKATSNICSNEALCAVRALIYLSLVGKSGLKKVAATCAAKAKYARTRLTKVPGVSLLTDAPTFNEFTLKLPARDASDIVEKLAGKGIAAGLPLGRYYPALRNCLLVAVTEKRTEEEIGLFAEELEAVL